MIISVREPTRPAKALGRAWQSRPAGSTARGPNRRAAPALMLPATTITTACNLSAHLASYLVLVEGKVPSIISSTHCKIHHGQSLCVHVAYAYPSLLSGARRPRDCTHKSPTSSLLSVLQQITSRSWRSHANRTVLTTAPASFASTMRICSRSLVCFYAKAQTFVSNYIVLLQFQ